MRNKTISILRITILITIIGISSLACHYPNLETTPETSDNVVIKELIAAWIGRGQPLKYPGECLTNHVDIENREYKCITICTEGKCECVVIAGEWNGDIYTMGSSPPKDFTVINNSLDMIKTAIISKGISEAYFNEHFDLVEVRSEYQDFRTLSASYMINIGEYHTSFSATVYIPSQHKSKVASLQYDELHEITSVIPRKVAEDILKNCLGKSYNPQVSLEINGDLVLTDYGDGNCASVNLETGKCRKWDCPPGAVLQ